MKKISRYFGPAGLVLAILGGLGYGLAPQFKGFYVIPWALAAAALSVYLVFNFKRVSGFASSRQAKYGAGSAAATLLVLGVLAVICIMTARHSARYDLTMNKQHSLAPQTTKILQGLDQEVKVTGFYQGQGGAIGPARDLLDQYAHASDRFRYELVDPDRYPERAKAEGVTRYGVVIVKAGGESEKISRLSEERLTNAVLRVTRPGKKAIYFLTGHGEKDTGDSGKAGFNRAGTSLKDQNYQVRTLLLMRTGDVPADAAVLVVAGPKNDLEAGETEAVERYLRQGGKALFLIDPETVPGLVDFLVRFNVKAGHDKIVDKMGRLYAGGYLTPIVAKYSQHPVTDKFTMVSFFPVARSVSVTGEKARDVEAAPLAYTGDQAWAETNLARLNRGKAKFDAGEDKKGPVSVAVVGTVKLEGAVEKKDRPPLPPDREKRKKEGKFIVFGDSDFASNANFNLQGNGDLFMSSVSWLAEEADLVAIRPKERKARPLLLSAAQARLIFWLPVVVLPLAVLFIGALVLIRRRQGP